MPARSFLAQEDRRAITFTLASMPAPMSPALQAFCFFFRSQVVHWLESSDMAGPLADARCQWGGPAWLRDGRTFSRDVGLSMFAASKVLRLRDQHLVKP